MNEEGILKVQFSVIKIVEAIFQKEFFFKIAIQLFSKN